MRAVAGCHTRRVGVNPLAGAGTGQAAHLVGPAASSGPSGAGLNRAGTTALDATGRHDRRTTVKSPPLERISSPTAWSAPTTSDASSSWSLSSITKRWQPVAIARRAARSRSSTSLCADRPRRSTRWISALLHTCRRFPAAACASYERVMSATQRAPTGSDPDNRVKRPRQRSGKLPRRRVVRPVDPRPGGGAGPARTLAAQPVLTCRHARPSGARNGPAARCDAGGRRGTGWSTRLPPGSLGAVGSRRR